MFLFIAVKNVCIAGVESFLFSGIVRAQLAVEGGLCPVYLNTMRGSSGKRLWPPKNWDYSDVIRWDSSGQILPFFGPCLATFKKNQSRLSHNRSEY